MSNPYPEMSIGRQLLEVAPPLVALSAVTMSRGSELVTPNTIAVAVVLGALVPILQVLVYPKLLSKLGQKKDSANYKLMAGALNCLAGIGLAMVALPG